MGTISCDLAAQRGHVPAAQRTPPAQHSIFRHTAAWGDGSGTAGFSDSVLVQRTLWVLWLRTEWSHAVHAAHLRVSIRRSAEEGGACCRAERHAAGVLGVHQLPAHAGRVQRAVQSALGDSVQRFYVGAGDPAGAHDG
ncbi:hypothetical protein OPT61_g5618 [Boeremia exigua]|uniref:Uncharacterized protein n=1 Tax=Boeremia exigua TaxID=749465 RepID=A0ACC2I9M0_9PLEO|nr:hypothetical protein OPT61_g5618 [Boeremia exigua]